MTPERFDTLTRLWYAAPSRRAFLQGLCGFVVIGALDKFGLRAPGWMGLKPKRHEQCYPERDGMLCGGCGICQRGTCVPNPANTCSSVYIGLGRTTNCTRCDPRVLGCVPGCPKGQNCCKDRCCDGPCSADGACCPPGKVCGEQCCKDCEKCEKGQCVKGDPQTVCPPNWTLIDGCCVCQRGLCGDQCCPEKETCLDGRCCKVCGKDGAICCADDPALGVALDRVCCKERCIDAHKKCCPCMEDISPEESNEIFKRAQQTMERVRREGITYAEGRGDPKTMDCSGFNVEALGGNNTRGSELHTRNLDGNCDFRRLEPNETPRAGDVVAQPRSSGPPGSQHTGIAQGSAGPKGGQLGIQMGSKGANVGVWGLEMGHGGWFEGHDQLHAYRPQKRKENCKE
jgi:hypothetical protein